MNNLTPAEGYNDSEPKAVAEKTIPLKTNYKDPKKRYELAERMVWAKLPDWKKQVVIKCRVEGIMNDRIFNEYAREITELAESENAVLSDTYPPVPHFGADKKPALTK